jgi:hypothetical protein
VKERSCQFGEGRHLAGIVTEPSGAAHAALVLVSAGLVPKFGPFRLYTELARRLACDGVVTLRFDIGGVGDSRHFHSGLALKERTLQDVGSAVDWVVAHDDFPHLVLGGLCSGAEDSFRYAEQDARVAGVVMIDPFAYRTAGFLPRHVLHRVVRRTRRALGLYRPIAPVRLAPEGTERRVVQYDYMGREESSRVLSALVERRAHVHFVYTGGTRDKFNHEGQLHAMFPNIRFHDLVTVDYFPDIEHTQMLAADREKIVGAIAARLRWLAFEPRVIPSTTKPPARHAPSFFA